MTKAVKTWVIGILSLFCVIGCEGRSAEQSSSEPTVITSADGQDRVMMVDSDDDEMKAAIEKGKATLDRFLERWRNQQPGDSIFSLKVPIKENGETEYFWIVELAEENGEFSGEINNEAIVVKNVKIGDRISFKKSEIADWMYVVNEKIHGAYTLRAMLKDMTPERAQAMRSMLADE